MKDKMKNNNNIMNEILSVLETLKEDAEMALEGTWDKSDDGFEAQITLIDKIILKIQENE